MISVAILGCGPTGLLAAHACALRDIEFVIYSKKRKSQLFGSQYLHEPIPDIIGQCEGEVVRYVNIGTPEEYRRKTHGKFWDGIVSPADFETEHMAWNIREAYDRLWRLYGQFVFDYEIKTRFGPDGKIDFSHKLPSWRVYDDLNLSKYNLVVSTVPRRIWATPGERYIYSEGWAAGDAPEHGKFVELDIPDMTIECNGDMKVPYNRLSCVFGYKTIEFPSHNGNPTIAAIAQEQFGATSFIKPLKYVPDMFDGNPVNAYKWLHVGRYGQWQKGVVTTDAWHDVNKRLDKMLANQ